MARKDNPFVSFGSMGHGKGRTWAYTHSWPSLVGFQPVERCIGTLERVGDEYR